MSKINILSSKIYNRISAGEVVERPASVVKELVENSIDADASIINVEILDGGITSIKVIDNGSGIEKSQIKNAILPHATSKISKLSDLDCITSLGFRGEALASIASVSKFSIISKTKDVELGAKLHAEGGENVTVTDVGALDGTEVIVDNLFFNTPAREKFLKSPRSEEGEISSYMMRLILSNPNISFKYIADGKTIYQSFGDGLESAFISIYGLDVIRDCFKIETERNGIKICGYVGKHHFTKSNRSHQSIFLNGRYVINQTISSAISNAYSSYLMKRQYPFYVLCITLPVETVDVNVHPNKLDVRFSNNQIVYSTIYNIISKVLDGSSEIVNIISKQEDDKTEKIIDLSNDTISNYATHTYRKNLKNETYGFDKLNFSDSGAKSIAFRDVDEKKDDCVDIFAENKAYIEKLEREKQARTEEKQEEIKIEKQLNYIGQALNTYLIFDDGEDLIFVDQHAAHERIIFDKLKEGYSNKDIAVQPLLLPIILDVNVNELEFLLQKMEFFNKIGMEIEQFGRNSLKICSIPLILDNINIERFFDLILHDLNSLRALNIEEILFEKIAQKACKSAIKSGDKISEEETNIILEQIKSNFGLKCPHGRPIAVKVTRNEVDKWFKRII